MVNKNWLQIASGIGFLIAAVCVVVQSMSGRGPQSLVYGTSLVAVFGYLFLSSSKENERDTPWWW